MPEFSPATLGLLRRALEGMVPLLPRPPFDVQRFWKQTLLESGFARLFIDLASSAYSFDWTEIIFDLSDNRFGDKNSHFGRNAPPFFCQAILRNLMVFALNENKNPVLIQQIRNSLQGDCFDISNTEFAAGSEEETQKVQDFQELQIFISHSSEDKPIASALVELLKNALGIAPQAIRCTSVDGHRLSVGTKTEEHLRQEILNAKSFIALLTEHSLNSTWVLFELGARWGFDLPLAPVFAGGLTANQLHGPLPGLSGLSCDSDNEIHQLVNNIADLLGFNAKQSQFYSNYVIELRKISAEARQRGSL